MDVYVLKDGRRAGPYQPFLLREMIEEGTLLPGDVVWHEGMENWQPLEKTESLGIVLNREPSRPEVEEKEPEPKARPAPAPGLPDNPEALLVLLRTRRILASRRFFARQIDMLVAGVLTVGVAASLGYWDVWELPLPESFFKLMLPAAVWMIIEPVLLTLWGTTPGKAALGLRVETADGGRLSLGQAFLRSSLVWAGGMGFGLRAGQYLPVAQWGYAWWMLQRRGTTLWDHTARTTVRAVPLRRRHAIGLGTVAAGFIALWLWLTLGAPLPERMHPEDRSTIEDVRRQFWQPGK